MTLGFADLRPKQPPAIKYVYNGDQTLLLADVGTGKTVIAMTAMQWWAEEDMFERALVVAPRRVCLETWMPEIDNWSHLSNELLRLNCLVGLSPKKRAFEIETSDDNVFILNFENLSWIMGYYPDGVPGFSVLIIDELDKLKDHKTITYKGKPRRRGPIDEETGKHTQLPPVPGVKDWKDTFEIRVGMTGTPTPNHLLDIWAEAYVIDNGERLGDNFYTFRTAHFYQSDWAGFKYEILPGREEYIYDRLANITHRIASEPGVDTPHVVELPVRWVELEKNRRAEYKELERNYVVELKRKRDEGTALELPVEEDDDAAAAAEVEADNAGVLYGKLRQMAQGFAYVENPDDPEDRAYSMLLSHRKMVELDSLISELQGQQLMIVYHFRAQLQEMRLRYGKRLFHLGGRDQTDKQISQVIENWLNRQIELIAAQPQNAAHGLNLQKGGAHHIARVTLPETAGLNDQVIGRLARGGNPEGTVYVHTILTRDTVDEERLAVVQGKIQTADDFLDAMEARQ